MTNIKQKAKEEIIVVLRRQKRELEWDLDKGRLELAKLTERQTIMKRKKVELDNIIYQLSPTKE